MKERPAFPARVQGLGEQPKPRPAAPAIAQPQGIGLDSGAVRQRMVDKLMALGLRDAAVLVGVFALIAVCGLTLYFFFRTNLGTAMRAAGNNPQMIRALGVNVDALLILGLALSNGLIALSGSLLAQYEGFADVQMGVGMVVWGLASVIIGEALVGSSRLGLLITGAVMGSLLFRLLVAIALRWGLDPNDLKIVTASFVFIALVAPSILRKLKPIPVEKNA